MIGLVAKYSSAETKRIPLRAGRLRFVCMEQHSILWRGRSTAADTDCGCMANIMSSNNTAKEKPEAAVAV